MTYGFAAITPDIASLDKAFQNLFRNILSPLKVNMNIRTFYRIAPKRFQGLGLPNPLIIMLSQKLYLLQTQFNQSTATGRMLQQSLEVFQMEVGLSSNILEENFSPLGNLATDRWWKHLWQLCHKFRVTFALSRKWQIPLLRSDDVSFMGKICETDLFTANQHLRINRVRKYKGIHSFGDFVLCDGHTPDRFVFNQEASNSSRVFSVENPTATDFARFGTAVDHFLTEPGTLRQPLGAYMTSPHCLDIWFVDEDRSALYRYVHNSSYVHYTPPPDVQRTRQGTTFSATEEIQGQCPCSFRASVVAVGGNIYTIHSTAAYVTSLLLRGGRSFNACMFFQTVARGGPLR